MPDYNPTSYQGTLNKYVHDLDMDANEYMEMMTLIAAEFTAFEPDPAYNFGRPTPSKDVWPVVEAKTAPIIGDLPAVMQKMMAITWKHAEPSNNGFRVRPASGVGPNALNKNVFMGMRGMQTGAIAAQTYHKQQQPHKSDIGTRFDNNDPLASDWNYFNNIKRVNAVAFRGDTRSPAAVIKGARGFFPPNTRTDRAYLVKQIYEGFNSYLSRRYKRTVSQEAFLSAVDSAAPTVDDKKILSDYLYWRKLIDKESSHLARMTDNELLKGYISTARALDSSIEFGSRFNNVPGWLYLTIVHGGFLVPFTAETIQKKKEVWATGEGEIAQYGPIPADRIVAFRRLDKPSILQRYQPVGPIFFRPSFRSNEPEAFNEMFKYMSGKTP